MVLGAEEEPMVGVDPVERDGRPDGNSETKLEEMRESVACAGCGCVDEDDEDGDANAEVEEAGGGDEDVGSDVVELVGEDMDGGEALPLRRGGSG